MAKTFDQLQRVRWRLEHNQQALANQVRCFEALGLALTELGTEDEEAHTADRLRRAIAKEMVGAVVQMLSDSDFLASSGVDD